MEGSKWTHQKEEIGCLLTQNLCRSGQISSMQNPSCFPCELTPKSEPFSETQWQKTPIPYFPAFSQSVFSRHRPHWSKSCDFNQRHYSRVTTESGIQYLSYPSEQNNTRSAKLQFAKNKLLTISVTSRAVWLGVVINLYLTTYNICPVPFSYCQNMF